MKYIHPTSYIGLVMAILLITSTLVALSGYVKIHRSSQVLLDLYQLRTDITGANLALRNAGMARTPAQMEIELSKMLITRASANDIYDRLAAASLEKEDKVIVAEMRRERVEYREAQLKVVSLIRDGKEKDAWESMMYYQTLMDRYLGRVDKLIKNVSLCSEKKYNYALATLLTALVSSLALGACAIRKLYWGPQCLT